MMLSKIDKNGEDLRSSLIMIFFSSCGGSRQLHLVNGLK